MSARKSAAQVNSAKQKKIAIGGAVLLVGVLVIQGPKMLKLVSGGSSSSATPAPAVVTPPVTPGAVPGAPTPVSAAPGSAGTKFVSVETFGTKDPFAPQVNANSTGTLGGRKVKSVSRSGVSAASGSTTPSTTGSSAGTTSRTTSSAGTSSFKVASGASAATATITVNAKRQVVTVNHDFPTGDPVFTLVRVGSGSASVAIAGGSLKRGGKTFTLTVGTPLTLLNTATGTKYKLELLSTAPSGA